MENKRTIFVSRINTSSMGTKLRLVFSITMLFLCFYSAAQTNYWKITDVSQAQKQGVLKRFKVDTATTYTLAEASFKNQLTPLAESTNTTRIVYFPDEKGQPVPFKVKASNTFSKELLQKYPAIRSYKGTSALNDGRRIRFSVSPKGIHTMMTSTNGEGAVFMEKAVQNTYILYHAKDRTAKNRFVCNTETGLPEPGRASTARSVNDQVLRRFRLAVAASGEYTAFHGGTKADALAAINATVTRINEIFENDLAVTLELVGATDSIIYTNAGTDPFSGGFSLSGETQNTLDTVIGDANYDIGHLFNQQDNVLDGNAGFVGSVCRTGRKGSAYSTFGEPEGNSFAIDLVAHEMGHQFGANHTFSYISEGTQVQVEPGSGTTIMGYAGITQQNDVAAMSDDYFHYVSIVQMSDFLRTVSCGDFIPLINNPPSLSASTEYTIPRGTAFVLDAMGTDLDTADVLTYTWEQIDVATVTQSTFGPGNPVGALFRSLPPSEDSFRYFPKLERIISGNLTEVMPGLGDDWETVSLVERTLNFAVTVRDNSLEGGQLDSEELTVFVTTDAGPFTVISQDIPVSYVAGEVQTIAWDVANTDIAPVSAATVDIFLSTDGGQTFPLVIAANVPNNGSHDFVVPAAPTANARIMVKASNSIFLAMNAADFSIDASPVVLNLSRLDYEICTPADLIVDFSYETHLGFDEESTFSVTGLPAGLTATFSTPTATDTDTPVSITFSGSANLALGTYPVQLVATAAGAVQEVALVLSVFDANFEDVVPVFPLNAATDLSADLMLEWEDNDRNTSYDVEISTDLTFSSLVETATTANAFYRPNNLDNNTTYYWHVKPNNSCGEGVYGPTFGFTTIEVNCKIESAVNLPLAISPIDTPTITSSVTFFEDLTISDINVALNIGHTFLADLEISLTSPAGTTVVLVSGSCGDMRNMDAVFDDDALPFVCGGDPAISGAVAPLGFLRSFNGESILGEWVLVIKDNANEDGGRLNAFSLDICAEGDFRPDEDGDGVFDDGDDLCPDTPQGQEVDAFGCSLYRFENQNFTIGLESETCRDNNDGLLTIRAQQPLNYEITVSGAGVNVTQGFTNLFVLGDLAGGVYDLCVTGTDGTIVYEPFCSQVVIAEPGILAVNAQVSLDGEELTIDMDGADGYTITWNDTVYQTQDSKIILGLDSGLNVLKVSTDLPCQGVFTEQFVRSDTPLVYPNPFKDTINLFFGNPGSTISAHIFTSDGRFVKSLSAQMDAKGTQLDLEFLATGLYFVQFSGNGVSGTAKIIKQ